MVKTEKSFSRIGIKNYLFENKIVSYWEMQPEVIIKDEKEKPIITYKLEFHLTNGKKLHIKDCGNKTFEWTYDKDCKVETITNWEEFENCLQNLLKHYQL